MPDLQHLLDQIQERAKTAGDHVAKLCTKEDRWKMTVPVQDDDSDILLTQITDRDVPKLAKALQAVMELHPRELGGTPIGDPADYCPRCMDYWPCDLAHELRKTITDAIGADDV